MCPTCRLRTESGNVAFVDDMQNKSPDAFVLLFKDQKHLRLSKDHTTQRWYQSLVALDLGSTRLILPVAIISTVIEINAASFIYLILRLYGKDLWTKIYNRLVGFHSCANEKQVEPRSVAQALEDPSWVDVMHEEMQQFKGCLLAGLGLHPCHPQFDSLDIEKVESYYECKVVSELGSASSVVFAKVEPRSVAQALEDPSWVDVMHEEMQQFKGCLLAGLGLHPCFVLQDHTRH
ncbi:hypothetical protein Tco_0164567 [Tanacetum coccineum]